ncbi:response regulator [Cellulomonas denverensis]|uniref:Response regulator transcription factor n=1 Tax=Cellulomonas denverensis TaxID=264297 RepID=A0A7X6QXP1_9CELL|nr:response regulator transcription factor [Cellulomonas denverensis]NKY21279.1 response regulator transcription factor [Cellulomonas denverensis]GIG24572.1 DNA-binding response regulator [Cellulomonas denverensis]
MTGIRVLLADDQALLRAALATILDASPDLTVVGQASTGREAVRLAHELRPDVVCMDVQMPELDGIEATRLIRSDPELDCAVLVLTTFNREDYLVQALTAGASGFLLKNSRPEQLADAVRAVAAGDALLSPEVTRSVISRAMGSAGVIAGPEPCPGSAVVEQLTDREAEVLRLVARGLSNDEIAAELVLGRATVKTHVSNVLTKLGLRDRVQAVVFAYRKGLAD